MTLLPEYSTSMENNVSQKWVMMCSLSKHNSAAMVKWWCNTGKGVIRVKMDDNKGGHLTHRVNDRIYGERGWRMSWVIASELDEWVMEECLLSHKKMSHRNTHQYQGGKMSWLSFPWNPSIWHLFSSPNLLQLLCTFDVLFKCFFIVIVIIIIEECKLWTIKWFPSTAATLLFQPSCISSRHYTSLYQWCHLVGRVASNAIMWYLDIMKCVRSHAVILMYRVPAPVLEMSSPKWKGHFGWYRGR